MGSGFAFVRVESLVQAFDVLMLRLHFVAVVLMVGTLVSPAWHGSTQTTSGGLKRPPIVTATEAPAGTETLPVKWVKVAVPDLGVMRAAVARPSGTGPFPAVLILHGTHGFARQYLEWANDLARAGFIAVAACWFSGGGATQQYLLAGGNVQAAVLHSSGYALRPWNRAAEFKVPILIMHGTADSFGENTQFGLAREFEMGLRANRKPVETAYCEGCGHNTFFTNSTQRDDELKRMIEFLRRHLGR